MKPTAIVAVVLVSLLGSACGPDPFDVSNRAYTAKLTLDPNASEGTCGGAMRDGSLLLAFGPDGQMHPPTDERSCYTVRKEQALSVSCNRSSGGFTSTGWDLMVGHEGAYLTGLVHSYGNVSGCTILTYRVFAQ
jgi:hypothetical protein